MWTICSWLPLTEFQRLHLSSIGLEKRSNARGLKCGASNLAALMGLIEASQKSAGSI